MNPPSVNLGSDFHHLLLCFQVHCADEAAGNGGVKQNPNRPTSPNDFHFSGISLTASC
jgi:hypothetical protein